MQINPRYGAEPLIVLDGAPAAILTPTVRQRRRLAEALGGFTDDQWMQPSRCAGWTNRDVIAHLDSTNTFWTFSIQAGLAGEPSRFLATFDPVATPAELVEATRETSTAEVLDRFVASTTTLVDLLESIDDEGWTRPAEAPPGHVSIAAVTHHALWDGWVHERDVLLPLGLTPAEEPDELAACLRYVAALAPGLALTMGYEGRGLLAVDVTEPTTSFVVEVDTRVSVRAGRPEDDAAADARLGGDALTLVEALSIRAPLDQAVPDDAAWLVHGLATVFDLEPT